MANLLFTLGLVRRLEGSTITVNAVHPGLVRSSIMNEANPILRFITQLISGPAERAAQNIVKVATAPEFAGRSGRFFHNGKELKFDAYASNRDVQDELWDASLKLTQPAPITA